MNDNKFHMSKCIKPFEECAVGENYRTLFDGDIVYVNGYSFGIYEYHKYFSNKPSDKWFETRQKLYGLITSENPKNFVVAKELYKNNDMGCNFKVFAYWCKLRKLLLDYGIISSDGKVFITKKVLKERLHHCYFGHGRGKKVITVLPFKWGKDKLSIRFWFSYEITRKAQRENCVYNHIKKIANGVYDIIHLGIINISDRGYPVVYQHPHHI